MAADNIHGVIGKKMQSLDEIIDFRELTQVVSDSSQKLQVIPMRYDDFYDFKGENRARNAVGVKIPILSNVCEVYFAQGSRLMYYKSSHSCTEYEGVDFLRAKFHVGELPKTQKKPRGISEKKKTGILRLLGHVDGLKRKFYNDIPINDKAKDLVNDNNA